MHSQLLDWLDAQPTPRRRLYSVLIALLLLTIPCYMAGIGLLALSGPDDDQEIVAPPDQEPVSGVSTPQPTSTSAAPTSLPPTETPRAEASATATRIGRTGATPDIVPIIRTVPALVPAEPTPTSADIILPLPTETSDVLWVTVAPPPGATASTPIPIAVP